MLSSFKERKWPEDEDDLEKEDIEIHKEFNWFSNIVDDDKIRILFPCIIVDQNGSNTKIFKVYFERISCRRCFTPVEKKVLVFIRFEPLIYIYFDPDSKSHHAFWSTLFQEIF